MKIGILGGSFDPVHCGHLGVARAAADALGFDRVLLIPAAQAPLRDSMVRASGAHRWAMLRAAVAEVGETHGEVRLLPCDVELRRAGMSYTVDTLRALQEKYPEAELTWIVGDDQLAKLPQWREPEALVRLAAWAVYTRPGHAPVASEAFLPGLRLRRISPEAGVWDISSTAVRTRLAAGGNVAGLVPDKVIEYIRENGLYRAN